MTRQSRKRPYQSRKARRQRRTQASYRHGLKDAIGKLLPGPFFSRWRVACPRTAANEKALKCAGKKKTGPPLFVTTLLHMGTGVPWDFRIGPGTASERRHLEAMPPDLPPRSLVVADAGFTGYEFYRRI